MDFDKRPAASAAGVGKRALRKTWGAAQ